MTKNIPVRKALRVLLFILLKLNASQEVLPNFSQELLRAIDCGHPSKDVFQRMVRTLLAKKNYDINTAYTTYTFCGPLTTLTALHLAISRGRDSSIVGLLLAHGAQVNAQDGGGRLPLHYALDKYSDYATIRLLVTSRSHLNTKDKRGRTPMDVIVQNVRHIFALRKKQRTHPKRGIIINSTLLPLSVSSAMLLVRHGATIESKTIKQLGSHHLAGELVRNLRRQEEIRRATTYDALIDIQNVPRDVCNLIYLMSSA